MTKNKVCLALLLTWSACHAGAVPPRQPPKLKPAMHHSQRGQKSTTLPTAPDRVGKLRF
ncbi:MAG: hypothetical protein JNK87_32025 [Bryobacterales bacterium]|nr:hypothetical protein [Bryobacterales bacterium]